MVYHIRNALKAALLPGNQLKGVQADLVGEHEMQHVNALRRFCKIKAVGGEIIWADAAFQLNGGENISIFILHCDFLRVHRSGGVYFNAGNVRKIHILIEQMGYPALGMHKMLSKFFGVFNMSVVKVIKLGCHSSF